MEGDVIVLSQNLFVFDYAAGMDEEGNFLGGLKSTGIRPTFLEWLKDQGIHKSLMIVLPSKPMTAALPRPGSER